MELHPILEPNTSPSPGLWYVLGADGEPPSERVGHTGSYMPGPDGHPGSLIVVGGANPSGPFADTYRLDLASLSWEALEAPGLRARYEHAAFTPSSQEGRLYVFAGADQGGNHNDIQVLDIASSSASDSTSGPWLWAGVVPASGTAPSARTYHTCATVGDSLVVYSGGQAGADPVGDRQVHMFNAAENSWSTLSVRGDPPKPRHGHVVAGEGQKVYVHGGMAGTAFYADLHVLDLKKGAWSCPKAPRTKPSARAAHAGCVHKGALYVFGGMNKDGALDDLWSLNTVSNQWSQVKCEGPPPACRLDFSMAVVQLRVPLHADLPSAQSMAATGEHAGEVLGQSLRLGSAGSVHSVSSSLGSAGSQRSLPVMGSSAGSHTEGQALSLSAGSQRSHPVTDLQSPNAGSHRTNPSAGDATGPESSPDSEAPPCSSNGEIEGATSIEYKVIDALLIHGGMDTEGEIFDDTLITFLPSEEGENAAAH